MIEFPTHAPFNDGQKNLLSQALTGLDANQTSWLSGYLAAWQGVSAGAAAVDTSLTVLFGTESGNSEGLADLTVKRAKKAGFKATMLNMSDAEPKDLEKVTNLLVIVSTWGDGEPPEAAENFYNTLLTESVKLDDLNFSVCALGDTSYDQFCQTGKEIDERLAELGAKRLVDRADCDVDFDDSYAAWADSVFDKLGSAASAAPAAASFAAAPAIEYGKKNPFPAEVLDSVVLNGDYSKKETLHLEFSLEGSGFSYEPGDVLCVVPQNADDVIADLLEAAGLSGEEEVELKGGEKKALKVALKQDLDITSLSRKVVKAWQEISGSLKLADLLADDAKAQLKEWINGRQIVDLLVEFPAKELSAAQLVSLMRKLPPRLYSIASSPKAHEGEVHLTVAAVRYNSNGKDRKGVASTFLADDAKKGDKVLCYMHHNKNFRLPENDETPIIMVGPGTGVAPFRAFVEERAERGAKGESWLFFGDQHYNEDFLYQLEWQDHLKNGDLTKIDVAFSRDMPEKVYVQHKMLERAEELYQWLEKGAHFYVCGDASRMASDVNDALIEVISSQGGKSKEDAEAYIAQLKKDKRYQRDVY
ncbi:assimilatory sulfite reductase (NADPH) flavoprotein subunit [Persicirhabdus sediminis]|uniref:assimilatory sulfite reductase (NADPH) n=1 Tax=Persicirhabdus sediminis TaxID=454144 RepID=A0A8J7SNL4_9BACT|nr:assimilatory sulfite reductase (NADPH) flavoprotein subunit [Persicirhabdus sediminis]MBK1791748.1 assimilatory sulfite reductase (NADPH) flavoprotein subunit [Persicirhabdus sediminis]